LGNSVVYILNDTSLSALKFNNRNDNSGLLKIPLLLLSISIYFLFSGLSEKSFLPRNKLMVIAIDVGQGDSFFVNSPEGKKILIDCGNVSKHFDNGERTILPLLRNLDVEKLDYVFISHLDRDHYGGFYSLERSLKIDSVYFPKPLMHRKTDAAFIDSLKKYRVAYYHKKKIYLGNSVVYILNDTSLSALKFNNRNDNSGLLKIVFGNNSILFTGDLSGKAEKVYDNLYSAALRSDILKVGHHGSAHSTTLEFLDNVRPQTALISVGAYNKFHHPSEEVIEKLKVRDVKIYRTDKLGALVFTSNGNNWRLIDWRKDW
jgi:competence protein ComEC